MKIDLMPIIERVFRVIFSAFFTYAAWVAGGGNDYNSIIFILVYMTIYILIDFWYGIMDSTYHFYPAYLKGKDEAISKN